MIKKCKLCGKQKEMRSNQVYCSTKCKKTWENSKRGGKYEDNSKTHPVPASTLTRPAYLDGEAAEYWDKVAPLLVVRGHLNALSEDVFVELCDLIRRIRGINAAINETNQSLLNGEEEAGVGGPSKKFLASKESALSDIKRKYSKLLLDYSKQFYLTPLSNRGNFGMPEEETDPLDDFIKGQNGTS